MSSAGLSLEQTPPIGVPLRFLLTAPLFGVAAALVVLWAGPAALASRWAPATLAATHLITLGFLTMAMLGAMQQMLPVLAGSSLPYPRVVSRALHALLVLGVLLLAAGFLWPRAEWMRLSVPVLGAAMAIALSALGSSLLRVRSSHASVRTMRLAAAALAVTAGFGLYLAAGHGWGFPWTPRVTDLHVGWGVVGWLTLLVAGVAYQVVPMFQITPDYPAPMMRWLTPALFALLVLWTLAHPPVPGWPRSPLLGQIAGVLIVVGVALFALVTLHLQMRRRRRLPDVTLAFWRVGMASLLLALGLWLLAMAVPSLSYLRWYPLLLGTLVLIGFGASVVNGMLYKIVPFLIWLHLHMGTVSGGAARGHVPNMKEIIPESRARRQLHLHLAALILLCAAPLWPAGLTYAAGALFAVSWTLLWANLLSAARVYRRLAVAVP
jgi:hypothetical protein